MLDRPKPTAPARSFYARHKFRVVAAVAAMVVVPLLVLAGAYLAGSREPAEQATADPAEASPAADINITLTSAKTAAAHIHTSEVERRVIQDERRVPGRIGYNETRRREVKMPVDGVVIDVLAKPGDVVKKGDDLAILSSVAVGLARDQLVQSEADEALARRRRNWTAEIAENLETLQRRLHDEVPVEELESEFQDRPLGDHRDKIMSAYSKYLLAEGMYESSKPLSGTLPGVTIRQRQSDKEVTGATFHGICEQSRFDAVQQRDLAQAALEHAERLVAVNRQKLQLQIGPFAEIVDTPVDSRLCELVLRSGIDGIVEQRLVTNGTQFTASQALFVLANVDTLWVSAQIYEREWADFDPQSVKQVVVECPAVPDKPLTATPLFVSVGASPQSRAVPLVAELANEDGRLRPGMFAWVKVPFGKSREALIVPEGAIARHESQTFVFVAADDGSYRKTDVTVGLSTPDWVEITAGLQAGDRVVSEGAFYLKSEWLLEGLED